jgi:hypothetical protein
MSSQSISIASSFSPVVISLRLIVITLLLSFYSECKAHRAHAQINVLA